MKQDEERRIAMEVFMLGAVAAKRTIQAMESHDVLAEAGVSMLQFGVLRALRRQAYTISELSPVMMVDPSTLVSVVDALERKGLAVRGRDPDDRRRVPISVTEKGAQVASCSPAMSPFSDEGNPLFSGIAAMGLDRARLLLALLRELVGHLPDGGEILTRTQAWVELQSPAECLASKKEEE